MDSPFNPCWLRACSTPWLWKQRVMAALGSACLHTASWRGNGPQLPLTGCRIQLLALLLLLICTCCLAHLVYLRLIYVCELVWA